MSYRNTWLASALLVLGCLFFSGSAARAGEKTKGQPKTSGALLTKDGELTADDEKDTHPELKASPRKVYKVQLVEGKTYKIELRSNAFDAVLRLENAAGMEVAFNDDAEGEMTLDSRIVYKAPKSEEYKVIATCLDGQLTGRKNAGKFTLTVVEVGSTGAGEKKKTDGTLNSKYVGKVIELKLKDGKVEYPSELDDSDPKVVNRHYKLFTVQMEKGKIYRIDYRGKGDDPKYDAYLFLEDAAGNQLDFDDDDGGGLDSRIVYKAVKTDTYRLITTTLPVGQTGKFILEIGTPSAEETKEAELKYRINTFANLSGAQRKNLIQELGKRFKDKGEDLTVTDVRLARMAGLEAEIEDVDLAREFYKSCTPLFAGASNKQIAFVSKQFAGTLKNLDKIGKELEVVGKTITGKDFDLKNLKGKVVLVDFWGTWCPPCVAEIPNMVRAYEKYHGKGFDVIGISSDKNDDVVLQFSENRKLPWACINVEDSRKIIDKVGVTSYPHPVLVDQAGRVVSFRARGPQLERLLEKMLGTKK